MQIKPHALLTLFETAQFRIHEFYEFNTVCDVLVKRHTLLN